MNIGLAERTALGPVEERAAPFDTVGTDERAFMGTVRSIARDFPSVSLDGIADLLRGSLSRTAGARVQTFRLVLAERATRDQLHGRGLRAASDPLPAHP